MANIYNIDNWVSSTQYTKNKIVFINNYYYYALLKHTSSSSFTTDLNNGKWGGVINYNNKTRPNFIWSTDYGYNLDITPIVNTIQFGDGYVQDINNNINNTLLKINVNFSNRDLEEQTAILHFLHARNGSEKFFFTPPSPYSVNKIFVCKNWNPSQEFYNSYSVKAVFEERII